LLHFDGFSNFRDIGGLPTADGRTVRTGVLFRSDALHRMTKQDLVKLQNLDIKLICDLRSPTARKTRLPSSSAIQLLNIPLHEEATQGSNSKKIMGFLFGKARGDQFREFIRSYYRHIVFERSEQIREVITLLSKKENLPAVFHCTAGRDRTGLIAAIIQLLLGVSYGLVREEYLRTNDYFRPRMERFIKLLRVLTLFQVSKERMRLILMVQPEFLDHIHNDMLERYGSVEGYLRGACGIEQDTLQALKAHLLE
jgi:protein-tyrosine phosphatase